MAMTKKTVNRDDLGKPLVRLPDGRFGKGNKTGGRPAVAQEFRAFLRQELEGSDHKALKTILDDNLHPDHFRAVKFAYEQVYGEAPKTLTLAGDQNRPLIIKLSWGG